MTDKELKRLSRKELLEMLILQTEENEKLRFEVERLTASLQDRQIAIGNAGSIADAALQLNGVFEAAQKAADQYVENLRQMQQRQDVIAQKLENDAKKRADEIIAEANLQSKQIREEADLYVKKVEKFLEESDRMQQFMLKGWEGHA